MKTLTNILPSALDEKRNFTPVVKERSSMLKLFDEYSDPSDLDESFEIIPDIMVSEKVAAQFKCDDSMYTQGFNEYKNIVFDNMYKFEEHFMPKESQHSIDQVKRFSMVDWIARVSDELALTDDSLYHCITLYDRICKAKNISGSDSQLYIATALWISTKLEETLTPAVSDFVYLCGEEYTEDDFIECESKFCEALNFELVSPTPYEYLISLLEDIKDEEIASFAKMFLRIASFHHEYSMYKPSVIALSCIYLSALCLGKKLVRIKDQLTNFNPNLVCMFTLYLINAFKIIINPSNVEVYLTLEEKFPNTLHRVPCLTQEFVNDISPPNFNRMFTM